MTTTWTRTKLEEVILNKASECEVFKNKLLTTPKEAVSEFMNELGLNSKVLQNVNIKSYKDEKNDWHIHLPHNSKDTSHQDTKFEGTCGW